MDCIFGISWFEFGCSGSNGKSYLWSKIIIFGNSIRDCFDKKVRIEVNESIDCCVKFVESKT